MPLLVIAMLVVMLAGTVGAVAVRAQEIDLAAIDFSAQTEIPPEEYAALVALYYATGGPSWTTPWTLPTDSPCSLYGVSCMGGHVAVLNLSSNNLSGALPPDLGDLQELMYLILYDNALTGEIPAELGSLSKLAQIELANNELDGEIPPELGNLSQLWSLNLGGNRLSGEIPPELVGLSTLQSIYLFSNELSGPIPTWIDSLSNLWSLSLGDNHFTGTIPAELGNLATLSLIGVDNNHLSGPIPAELGSLSNLNWLELANNQLVGPIPHELAGLTGLTILDLDYNMLWAETDALDAFLAQDPYWFYSQIVPPTNVQATPLGGGVRLTWTPPSGYISYGGYYEVGIATTAGGPYTSAAQITQYDATGTTISALDTEATYYLAVRTFSPSQGMQYNDLLSPWGEEVVVTTLPGQAQLPDAEYAALQALYHAAGGDGWTTGWTLSTNVPCDPGVLPGVTCSDGHVTALTLAGNGLAGTLPPELGDLSALQTLDLSGNALSGAIPEEMGNLGSLMYLQLNDNQLEGVIPVSLGGLHSLRRLSLGGNRLSGTLPTELGNLTDLYWLTLQNNRLAGPIPQELAQLSGITMLDLSFNALWAEGDALDALLANDPDWAETQAAPPTNPRATPLGGGAQLTWSPITYQAPGSYYEVGVSFTAGGPYTAVTQTTDTAAAEASVTGLAPGATTYLAVRTFSPAGGLQHNDLLSPWGEEMVIHRVMMPLASR